MGLDSYRNLNRMSLVRLRKKMRVSKGLQPNYAYFLEQRIGRRNYFLYLTIGPVLSKSFAIWGIEGTKVPDTKTE